MGAEKRKQIWIPIVVSAACAVVLGVLMTLTPMFPSSWIGYFYVGIFHALFSAVVPNIIAVWVIAICLRILLSWLCALLGLKKRGVGIWCEVLLSILNIGYTLILLIKVGQF